MIGGGGVSAGWIGWGTMSSEMPPGGARLISICSNKCGCASPRFRLSVWQIKWDLQSGGLLVLMCSNYQPGSGEIAFTPLWCQEMDETDGRSPACLRAFRWKTRQNERDRARQVGKFGSEFNSLSDCRHKTSRHCKYYWLAHASLERVSRATDVLSREFGFHEKWKMWAAGEKKTFLFFGVKTVHNHSQALLLPDGEIIISLTEF